eukprot:scaffold8038_cov363-Prasinococcus_capsulatus_cf.AAC.1
MPPGSCLSFYVQSPIPIAAWRQARSQAAALRPPAPTASAHVALDLWLACHSGRAAFGPPPEESAWREHSGTSNTADPLIRRRY